MTEDEISRLINQSENLMLQFESGRLDMASQEIGRAVRMVAAMRLPLEDRYAIAARLRLFAAQLEQIEDEQ